jgi:maltooligosyltrehalose trehalohydrolase
LHRDLLALRRNDPVFGQRPCRVDGAVLSDEAWVLRFFAQGSADRLLIVNLGRDLQLDPMPEPLLAPVEGQGCASRYGGAGMPALDPNGNRLIPGHGAIILSPGPPAAPPAAAPRTGEA